MSASRWARVELQFADGLTLNDDATEDVAPFITDEPVTMPETIVVLDADATRSRLIPRFRA
jgi:hypothetical protein